MEADHIVGDMITRGAATGLATPYLASRMRISRVLPEPAETRRPAEVSSYRHAACTRVAILLSIDGSGIRMKLKPLAATIPCSLRGRRCVRHRGNRRLADNKAVVTAFSACCSRTRT